MDNLFEIQKVLLDDFHQEEIYCRNIFKTITYDAPVTGLVGSRGIGKTTFLLHQVSAQIAKKNDALYVSADNLYFLEHRLVDLVDQLYKETNVRLLCVDEIQKYPNWDQELKNISDTYRHFRILFSGSSMIELTQRKYDLSRRVTLHTLHGFSFREYLEFYYGVKLPTFSLKEIVSNHRTLVNTIPVESILKHFKDYLKIGYYPFFHGFTLETEKFQAIENAVQKTIYEDISLLHALKTPTLMLIERINKYVINSVPGELSAYKISSVLEKDFDNISEYLRYLQQAGLIRFLYPKKSGKAYLRNPSKLYPDNTNLIYSSYLPLAGDSTIGKVRETFVINQLQNAGLEVYYDQAGDFRVADYLFEVGGRNKTIAQIKHEKQAYVLADGVLTGSNHVIPLYLLGFMY